jgi:hypothetical protein
MNLQTREYLSKFPKDLQQLCWCLEFLGYDISVAESTFPGISDKFHEKYKSTFIFDIHVNKNEYTSERHFMCIQSSFSQLIAQIYSTIDKFLQNNGMSRKTVIMKCQLMGFQKS